MLRRALCFLCVVALSACAGAGTASRSDIPTVPASMDRTAIEGTALAASITWNVGEGASTDHFALQDLDFYPNVITIDAGDKIAWHVASGAGGDAHTLTFLVAGQKPPAPNNPIDNVPAGGTVVDGTKFVNSGIVFGGQILTYSFPKPGTYPYMCLFHEPAMVGTVVVQKAGAPYPHNAQYYLDQGALEEWEDLGQAQISVASFPFKVGGTTFAAGIDKGRTSLPPPDSTVLRFLNTNDHSKLATSGNTTIKVGTKLTWVNETSNEPHTITFPPAGQPPPNINPDGPQIGGSTYDGTKLVGSAALVRGQSYSLTFTRPGTFKYYCLFHDNSGMVGTITVTP